MRVQIVTLNMGQVRVEQSDFMLRMARDPRYELVIGRARAKPVTNNRCRVMRQFRQSPPDHQFLLMLDNDVVPMGNPLDYVEHDLDIVVFPCPLWKPGQESDNPIVWNIRYRDAAGNIISGGLSAEPPLQEISEGGTGAMLVARRVADHPALRQAFVEQTDADGVSTLGHDLSFCVRAREAGFKIWGAMQCPCSHYDDVDLAQVYKYLRMESAR